jgi:hypothetical protein
MSELPEVDDGRCHAVDEHRMDGYEPGTLLTSNDGQRLLVVWGGKVVTDQNPVAVVYADPDAALTLDAVPVQTSKLLVGSEQCLRSAGRRANLAFVEALPVGAVFVETDETYREHWFLKTFHGVMLANGANLSRVWDGGADEHSLLALVVIPRGESPELRRVLSELLEPLT